MKVDDLPLLKGLQPRIITPPRVQIAQCTPSLGLVSLWWSRCVQSIFRPHNSGYSIFYLCDGVGGEIAEVRNQLVEMVLSDPNRQSHILWIDDDVLVFPGCLLDLLHQDKDIVSGVYFTKLPDNLSNPLIYSAEGAGSDRFIPNQCYPVYAHGMGLTLVRTDVYRKMAKELDLGLDKYNRPQWYRTSKMSEEIAEVNGVVDVGYTEDVWFCRHAAKLGYQPHILTTKHAFAFHYDFQKDCGYPQKQWQTWSKGEKIVWDTPDGPVEWD